MTQNERGSSPKETVYSPSRIRLGVVALGLGVAAIGAIGGRGSGDGYEVNPQPLVQAAQEVLAVASSSAESQAVKSREFQERIAAGLIENCRVNSVRLTGDLSPSGSPITEVGIDGKLNRKLLAEDQKVKYTRRSPISPKMSLREVDGKPLPTPIPSNISWKSSGPEYAQVKGIASWMPNPQVLNGLAKDSATYDIYESVSSETGAVGVTSTYNTEAKKYCGSVIYTMEGDEKKVRVSSNYPYPIGTVVLRTIQTPTSPNGQQGQVQVVKDEVILK